jgi:two-component system phosphate regulon response regulator OmpR
MNATDSAHLLVVDDDARLRSLLHRFLTQQGFRVTTAADAAEARALIKSIDFDCLILDVMMPGENGFDLASDLRTQSDLPILMLTARGESADRITGLERGADGLPPQTFRTS